MIKVLVKNESTVVKDIDVQAVVLALQIQHDRDFAPFWKTAVEVRFVEKNYAVQPGEWLLAILDNSDQAGALGYHDLTVHGEPFGKVFAKDDIQDGASWSVTVSHEFHEMIIDPWIYLAVQVRDLFYAYESDDAVEGDQFAHEIEIPGGRKIMISDSVTPAWFDQTATKGPYDVYGHVGHPLQLLDDGYIGTYDPVSKQWSQITARLTSSKTSSKAQIKPGHRRHRRMKDRETWILSLR